MLVPRDLQLETTNHCQLKCSFCPHKDLKRKKGFMDEKLFIKLIEDSKELKVQNIYLFLNGEPFLDKRIYDMVQYVKTTTSCNPLLYSNFGVPLKKGEIVKLRDAVLVLSISDGVDEGILERNLEILARRDLHPQIHALSSSPYLQRGFELSAKYGLELKLFYTYNWHSLIESKNLEVRNGYCVRPKLQMCVLVDGRVSLCCMDMEGEVILGDAKEQSLKEIWFGDKAIKYRETKKFDLEPCKQCNMGVL